LIYTLSVLILLLVHFPLLKFHSKGQIFDQIGVSQKKIHSLGLD